jgi:hypothetical protein
MGTEEEKEIQAKGIENILNKIMAGSFPNLERGLSKYRRLSEYQTREFRKETPKIYYN